jgi:hypothetical protein
MTTGCSLYFWIGEEGGKFFSKINSKEDCRYFLGGLINFVTVFLHAKDWSIL